MKLYKCKFSLLMVLSMLSMSGFSQIKITSANMPSEDDTIRYSIVPLAIGTDFGTTGANKNWDFKNLNGTSQDVYAYKKSSSTPYIINFGFSAIGLKIADSLGTGQMGLKNVYNFYKKSTAKWENIGNGFQLSMLPLPQSGKHSNPDEVYIFPLEYMDRDSSTFSLKIPLTAVIINIGNYFQDGTRITTVDGWGKISTPYASDIECIRVKSVISQTDSIAVTPPGQDPINFSFQTNRIEYKWLSLTEKIPMLEVSGTVLGNNFTPTLIRYRDQANGTGSVSVQKFKENLISIYPNPASDVIHVQCMSEISADDKLFIFDMNGKSVSYSNFNIEGRTYTLNTSNFQSGLYNLIYITNTGVYNSSFSINH